MVLPRKNEQACREAIALHYDLPVVGKEIGDLMRELHVPYLWWERTHDVYDDFTFLPGTQLHEVKEFLQVVAPFVEEGSHVDYFDDFGGIFRMVVINGRVEEWEAKIVFVPQSGDVKDFNPHPSDPAELS